MNSRQQLIDLNGKSTNFKLKFTATSKDKTPFEAAVVKQSMLDSGQQIQFQTFQGSTEGTIQAMENTYENHYLVLKSNSESECEIVIMKEDAPQQQPQIQEPYQPPEHHHHPPDHHHYQHPHEHHHHKPPIESGGFIKWRLVLFVLVGGSGIALLAWLYFRKGKDGKDTTTDEEGTITVEPALSPTVHHKLSDLPSGLAPSSPSPSTPITNSVVQRLRGLKPRR
jgi:hypothetical protein